MTEWDTAELIRASLRNLNLFGDGDGNNHGMSPEDRKEFLKNMLVSKKIIKIIVHNDSLVDLSSEEGSKDGEDAADDDVEKGEIDESMAPPKSVSMLLSDVNDKRNTVKHTTTEPCSICLTEFMENDKVSWSMSSQCSHMFHRKCIIEWLMQHNECPLCRHDFLILAEDEFEFAGQSRRSVPPASQTNQQPQEQGQEQPNSLPTQRSPSRNDDQEMPHLNGFFQGLQMFYLLSQLQDLLDGAQGIPSRHGSTTPPTSPSIVELVEGQGAATAAGEEEIVVPLEDDVATEQVDDAKDTSQLGDVANTDAKEKSAEAIIEDGEKIGSDEQHQKSPDKTTKEVSQAKEQTSDINTTKEVSEAGEINETIQQPTDSQQSEDFDK
jgi:hypothetical protein